MFSFLKSVYSEPDGTGSSSRMLSSILGIFCCYIIYLFTNRVLQINDPVILAAYLGFFPTFIGSLVLFFTAPYGVRKFSGSLTDIISLIRNKER